MSSHLGPPTYPRDNQSNATHGAVVLDTNVVSELVRPRPDERVTEWILRLPPGMVYTTSVTVAEVKFRITRLPAGRRKTALAEAADDVFGAFKHRVLALVPTL